MEIYDFDESAKQCSVANHEAQSAPLIRVNEKLLLQISMHFAYPGRNLALPCYI